MSQNPSENDPQQWRQNFEHVMQSSGKVWQRFLDSRPPTSSDPFPDPFPDPFNVRSAFFKMGMQMLKDPKYLLQVQKDFWQSWMSLWQDNDPGSPKLPPSNDPQSPESNDPGSPKLPPSNAPALNGKDHRFSDVAWHDHFVFFYIRQSYLMLSGWLLRTVHNVEGMDAKSARKVDFFTRQFVDAVSPSNFLLTNPEVMRETIASKGQNLVRGFTNLVNDMERVPGHMSISMTNRQAFRVGKNIAVSAGKIVFENDLFQLIHYAPRRKKILRHPLLVVPPWINRYYILDLNARKSFVRFALDQGLDVFMISWVNPDGKLREKTFGDYMTEGPMTALDVVRTITGEDDVHTMGYCIGGTLLSATLACMEQRSHHRPLSATFLATLVDFTDPGPIANFIDEPQVKALEERMHADGCLAGEDMALSFNMLRANDLIWSFVINNYLMGKDPLPFDLLYWNGDSTRMPEAMHSYYLRKMYLENSMITPDSMKLDGTPVDLTRVQSQCYFVATRQDHIAPWQSVFAGLQYFSQAKKRFVLSGSGHVAGIINPAQSKKYGYWTGGDPEGESNQWLDQAQSHEGSWWKDWAQWIPLRSSEKINPRIPGSHPDYPVIEDAPGRYVRN